MTILVTGAAGFIGSHVARALLGRGERVVGVDTLNPYYDPALKRARLARLEGRGFVFHRLDVADPAALEGLVAAHPEIAGVLHMAAQAGVRHSLVDPYAYVTGNVMGQVALFEAARRWKSLRQIIYASSSSVYGEGAALPFALEDRADRPRSLYAATKRAGELVAEAYAHLHGLTLAGLRFFTVYGPWGRPDMAPWIFADRILRGEPLAIHNEGRIRRDFTYIDDIVAGVLAVHDNPGASPGARLWNLGASRGEELLHVVGLFEKAIGRRAEIRLEPAQQGDVAETCADISATEAAFGWRPKTPVEEGVPRFVDWFRSHHGL